jgi:hypothetical protein
LSLPNSSYFYCPYTTLHTLIVPTQLFTLLLSLPNSSHFYFPYPTLHTFLIAVKSRFPSCHIRPSFLNNIYLLLNLGTNS